MRDDRYTEYNEAYDGEPVDRGYDPRGYEGQEPVYEAQPPMYEERRSRGGRPTRGERPVRGERPSRGAAPANTGAANPVLAVLGTAAEVVGGTVSSLAEKVRASRARVVEYEESDYLGTGTSCKVCGNPVDRLQPRCPHCGALVKPLYTRIPFWISVVVLLALVVALTSAISSCKLTQDVPLPTPQPKLDPVEISVVQENIAASEYALTDEANRHPYTQISCNDLRAAIENAKSAISNSPNDTQKVAQANQDLIASYQALVPVAQNYEWPFAPEITANPANYAGKQVALNGYVSQASFDPNGGVSSCVLSIGDNGETMAVSFYPYDTAGSFGEGTQLNVYGVLSYDGTTAVIWADKIDIIG